MKKGITLLLVLTLLVALAAPSAFAADETELIVFAAASMTETMNQIKELYEAENPGITLVYNFDSSGTLKTQPHQPPGKQGCACGTRRQPQGH